jgi:hypothetical protein
VIEITPDCYSFASCAFCGASKPSSGKLAFGGHHVCVEVNCAECGRRYLADLPVGHALYTPGAICLSTFELRSHPDAAWFSRSLVEAARAYAARAPRPQSFGSLEVVQLRRCESAVIVNCIDFLYGHVLLKLLNAQAHLEKSPGLGVIVVIPRCFRWLVPDEVAEIWLVDVPLSKGDQWLHTLVEAVPRELKRFEKVWLSLAYGSQVPSRIDISRFTRVKPFALERFTDTPCHFTIVAREDRLWFGSAFEQLCFRVLRRLTSRRLATRMFVTLQESRFRRLRRAIKAAVPQARFAMVGIGSASADSGVNDLRTRRMTDEVERQWCEAYARSHAVIGIHGSNMLLPTAHAAGVVEILPDDRQGNLLQDILTRSEGREASFLVRFAGEYASVREVAAHAIGIYSNYPVHRLQMSGEMMTHEIASDTRPWENAYSRALEHSKEPASEAAT